MEIRHTRVPKVGCPGCGAPNDTASAEDGAPKPGDFSVCFECGCVLRFGEDLVTRAATAEDWAEAPPQLARMQDLRLLQLHIARRTTAYESPTVAELQAALARPGAVLVGVPDTHKPPALWLEDGPPQKRKCQDCGAGIFLHRMAPVDAPAVCMMCMYRHLARLRQ